jgi:pimeloyl-ACP methyl ester carboxylesterase
MEEDGQRVLLQTDVGEVACLLAQAEGREAAVLWAGSLSGENRVSPIARAIAQELRPEGITSLIVRYRVPAQLPDCVRDTEAGILFLRELGVQRIALVGHSFSGAVVISAALLSEAVTAVVALASQTYGARGAADLSPRPLLLVHGIADQRLDPYCSEQIYSWAKKPKELVLIEGASHGLWEHRETLLPLLRRWLSEKLAASPRG